MLNVADSPLVALPAADAESPPEPAPELIESFRYRCRVSQFAGAPWAESLIGIAQHSEDACAFIEHVDALLRRAMFGADGASPAMADVDTQPLRLLSDRYRVLPTTPAWAAVSEAISRMRLARKGLGNTAGLIRDGQLLFQYADMLKSYEAADAVSLMLQAGATLAGMQAGARQPAQSMATRPRPQPADWTVGLTALLDGLRLDGVDLLTASTRLRDVLFGMMGLGAPVPGPLMPRSGPSTTPADASWTSEALMAAWPPEGELEAAVMHGYEAGQMLARTRPPEPWFVVDAWTRLEQRLLLLAAGQDGAQPAAASELACAMLGIGPAPSLSLRLSDAGPRLWTDLLLNAVVGSRAKVERAGSAAPPPLPLAAHALVRLGVRGLHASAQDNLLRGLALSEAAHREIWEYAAEHQLWSGDSVSGRVALVLGPWQESMAEEWPLPPRGGLILAATEANLPLLVEAGLPDVIERLLEPLRVAFEPAWTGRPGDKPFKAWVSGLPRQQTFVRLWLYREGRVGDDKPQLVDPDSADELWNRGPALESPQ